MATAKKTPAKKATKPAKAQEPTYLMPEEVKDWIERANSTIQHLRGQVERLKTENTELKAYRKFAETRILRSDHE